MWEKFILLMKYIILALIQGFAEILPISSSGHLVVAQKLLKMESEGLSFEIFLHFASLIAIIFFFRKRIWQLIKDFCLYIFKREKVEENTSEEVKEKASIQKKNFMYCIYIVLATIPAGVFGIILEKLDVMSHLENMILIGCFLIVTSILLFVSTKIKREKSMDDIKWYDALIIGLFQCLGILPGVSRSGSCLVGGAARKVKQSDAAEFAFILAIPVMLGSAILEVGDLMVTLKADTSLLFPYMISFIITLFVTYFSLKFFLSIVRKQKLSYFSIYCACAGVLFILLGIIL